MQILDVPAAFRPRSPAYPKHHRGPNIEEGFGLYANGHRHDIDTPLVYLPVYWWNLAFHNNKKSNKPGFFPDPALQTWLDANLKPDVTYFTISQCDDGIYERIPSNVVVFSAGGTGDIPIPLLCDPHPRTEMPRDCLGCFLGNVETGGPEKGVTGRSSWDPNGAGAVVRREMVKVFEGTPGFDLRNQKGDSAAHHEQFVHMLSRSVFTLCPRGYGRTSFRLYEALRGGSIPIYIYDDEPWLPFANVIDWQAIAIVIGIREISRFQSMIAKVHTAVGSEKRKSDEEIVKMQRAIAHFAPEYFTIEGASREIARMVTAHAELQAKVTVYRRQHDRVAGNLLVPRKG